MSIPQSSSDPPDGVGISFAADICKRNRQNIMVLRECVTSYTTSCIVQNEKHEDLRDALICLCCELNPLQGPLSVVRVDPAPGFRALIDDPILRKYRIQVEVGRIKNPNHNPVAEKAIQELELELVRQIAHTDIVTPRILAVVTARLNTRIRNNGMSAREMWFQRDQYTNEQLPINDFERICEQHTQREQNHVYSERSKCPHSTAKDHQEINIGDIVYLYVDKSKHQSRPRYLVVSIDGEWCMVRKFVGNTLRQLSYRVKRSECFKVPVDLAVPKLNPVKEEGKEEENVTAPTRDRSVTYHNHLISPIRDHQMTAMTNEPMQNESNSSPTTHEPINTRSDLHYDETSECTEQKYPVQPEYNQTEITTQHSDLEHVPLRRSTRTRKRPTFYPD